MDQSQLRHFLESNDCPELSLVRERRPYLIPKGYLPWRTLSCHIASALLVNLDKAEVSDPAAVMHYERSKLWYCQNAPVYCLSNALLKAFQETDISDLGTVLTDLQPPLPTLLLLFPQNAVRNPDGAIVDWCILHWSDLNYPERSQASADGFRAEPLPHSEACNLHWSTVDSAGALWFAGTSLSELGNLVFSHDIQAGLLQTNTADERFIDGMRSLALQVFLTLTYREDLLSQPESTGPFRRRLPKQRAREAAPALSPRWLGKMYQRRVPQLAAKRGNHGSPRTHWRRGHWRQQVAGVGRKERKAVWIEPTLVNA